MSAWIRIVSLCGLLALTATSGTLLAQLPIPLVPPSPPPSQPAAPAENSAPAPAAAAPAGAPSPPPPTVESPTTDQVTKDGLEGLRKRVDAATDLTEDQKKKGLEAIQKAQDALKQAEDFAASKDALQKQIEGLEENRKKWSRDAAALQKARWPLGETELLKLEQELTQKNQNLIEATTALQQVEQRIADREAHQRTITDRLAAIPAAVETLTQTLAKLPASTDPPLLVEAQRSRLLAERSRLSAEPAALQTEMSTIAAEEAVGLLQLQRQYWTQRTAALKTEISRWTDHIANLKRDDSVGRKNIARTDAEAAEFPELSAIYLQNAKIVEAELEVRTKLEQLQSELDVSTDMLQRLDENWKQLEVRESKIKSSAAFGIRLREERRKLPNVTELRREVSERNETYVTANLEAIQWGERFPELSKLDAEVDRTLKKIVGSYNVSSDEVVEIEEECRRALVQQQEYLTQLEAAYGHYSTALDRLNALQEQLAKRSLEFRDYIDERVLWIPSDVPLLPKNISGDQQALVYLLNPETWGTVGLVILKDLQQFPWLYALITLLTIGMWVTQGRQKKRVREYGQQATSRLNTSMTPTWNALLWTTLRAAVIPFPLVFLSWRCIAADTNAMVSELATYLLWLSLWIGWLDFVRLSGRPNGLGPAHFQWPARVNQIYSTQAASFLLLGTPLLFMLAVLYARPYKGSNESLDRILWITLFGLLAYSLHRLTSPRFGVLYELNDATGVDQRWNRLGALWHFIAVSIPVALAGLMVAGYTYAAEQLCLRLVETLVVLFAAVFTRALSFRWLTLRQRRLAVERAREVRAALAQAREEKDSTAASVLEAQEARTNLVEVSAQSKRLLNTTIVVIALFAAYLIWKEVLPALKYLDEYKLLGTTLTVSKLMGAIMAVILTTTAARNIPGLLEITILEQLPLDRSVRYAIGALTRYLILIIGITAVSKALGVEWQSIQWLVAALTFGLGFGMQDIFANFMSGLIILFEQPVRVGDVVTIDSTTGTVSRIRIRSTTIMDADRKEYIVPNRELITGKVLNWTLTDSTNRILLKVGVVYTSNPVQVQEILLQIVRSQPHVLTEPAPGVIFEGYGEKTMNFAVTAFLPSMEFRGATINSLYTRIHQGLTAAGIELPHPQREFEIRIPNNSPGLPLPVPSSNGEDIAEAVADAAD
ncbi:mechanosensitive ion channel domain-containing protein [Planctomicrobium sp. SH664]|uniref:mechanosensitive ion channel domain-containing protein n=1 Tax=Planctomicrobium sp. SH664 TaxID=3448125 RepID=UPI003F5BE3CE